MTLLGRRLPGYGAGLRERLEVGVSLEVVCGCTLGELEAKMKLCWLLCSTHGSFVGTHNTIKKDIGISLKAAWTSDSAKTSLGTCNPFSLLTS